MAGVFVLSSAGDCGTISGFTITRGNATIGGGIFCDNSSPTITNCTISTNTAGYGGGIWCSNSSPIITNCTISGNSAGVHAGGIDCHYSSPTITNCTISTNTAGYGGGIYCDYSFPTITNNIITNNSNYGIYRTDSSSNPTINYNNLWNNGVNCSLGVGNISSDPQFISTDDFHLKPSSPCIDKGINTAPGIPSTDKDGNPRIINGRVDMGAYEYQGIIATITGTSEENQTYTRTHTISYEVSSGPGTISFSEDGVVFGSETPTNGTLRGSLTLTLGDGKRFVYFKYKDIAGNTAATSDWIILDTTPPYGTIVINNNERYTNIETITLTLTYHDELSGVRKIYYGTDTAALYGTTTLEQTKTYVLIGNQQ